MSRARGGPLAGIRVVELAGMGPAPFAAMMLAELGADVVRVDRPPSPGGEQLGPAPQHDLLTRGRPTILVDMKLEAGRDVVARLVDSADVLLEGFRPGVLERLGLAPEALLARNPRLVVGRMTGWGQDGPLAGTAGHDLTYLARTGVLHAIGPAERPTVPLNVVGDFGGGALYLVTGVLAALVDVRTSGRGQVVDAAIVDGVAHLMTSIHGLMRAGLWQDERAMNSLDGGMPWYDVYPTSDGRHLAVAALEARFYAEFVSRLEPAVALPDRDDVGAWPELRRLIGARVAQRSLADWVAVFDGTDACVAPVWTIAEAAQDPQLASRRTLAPDPAGPAAAPAPRFSRTTTASGRSAAASSLDLEGTLTDWGLQDASDLVTAGVVSSWSTQSGGAAP